MVDYMCDVSALITWCQQCSIIVSEHVSVCVWVQLYIYYMLARNTADMYKRLGLVQLDRLCRLGYELLNWGVSAVCRRPMSLL